MHNLVFVEVRILTAIQMREVTAVIVRDARDQLKGDDSSTLEEWLRRSYVAWRLANLEEESFGGKSFW
jgi:RNA-dependent RNA polymerase